MLTEQRVLKPPVRRNPIATMQSILIAWSILWSWKIIKYYYFHITPSLPLLQTDLSVGPVFIE